MLPLGTSNNIALSLGLSDVVPLLVRGLASARETTFDIGLIESSDREILFVEAAGVGFWAAVLHNENSFRARAHRLLWWLTRRRTKGETRVRDAARGIARRIRHAPTRPYVLFADGADLSGDCLAVEVMNISSIGPRMRLAPGASAADGFLDLVLVRPEAREALATLIELGDEVRTPAIDCRLAHDVELSWPEQGHVDDEPWPGRNASQPTDRRVHLRVGGSVRLLLPQF
jgi:diacylglycerol kinase family enzyme